MSAHNSCLVGCVAEGTPAGDPPAEEPALAAAPPADEAAELGVELGLPPAIHQLAAEKVRGASFESKLNLQLNNSTGLIQQMHKFCVAAKPLFR